MSNPKRDEAARLLKMAFDEKDEVNAKAMWRFNNRVQPIYTAEMTREINEIDHRIHSCCEAIRAANASETQKERETRVKQELPLSQ
jgi:hypothetical protein